MAEIHNTHPNFRLVQKPLMGIYRLKLKKKSKLISLNVQKPINTWEYLCPAVQKQFQPESLLVKILNSQTITTRNKSHVETVKYQGGHFGLSKITHQSSIVNFDICQRINPYT